MDNSSRGTFSEWSNQAFFKEHVFKFYLQEAKSKTIAKNVKGFFHGLVNINLRNESMGK